MKAFISASIALLSAFSQVAALPLTAKPAPPEEKRDRQYDYDFYYAGGPAVEAAKRSPEEEKPDRQYDYDFYYAGGPAVEAVKK